MIDTIPARNKAQEKIDKDIAIFLEAGKKIQYIPNGISQGKVGSFTINAAKK